MSFPIFMARKNIVFFIWSINDLFFGLWPGGFLWLRDSISVFGTVFILGSPMGLPARFGIGVIALPGITAITWSPSSPGSADSLRRFFMKGCSSCPWCWPVPFKNGQSINCHLFCSLYGGWASSERCPHPGGKGLKGPKHPLSHYAKKGPR